MPALQEVTIKPSHLRSSDLFIWDGRSMLVEETSVGRTRVTVKDVTGKTTYVPLTTPQVTVKRMLPTEEEKAVELAERLEEEAVAIVASLRTYAASDPMVEFAAHAVCEEPQHASWTLKRTLEQHTDELFLSSCLKAFSEEVLAMADHDGADARKTVEIAVHQARETMMRGLDRFGSRSTSHFSNLLEDAQRASAARWLESFGVRYYIAKLEREVTD